MASDKHEVGIDIERIRPIREAEDIAAYIFAEPEHAQWRLLPDTKKIEAFFNCWVLKEAMLKTSGEGIGKLPDQTKVFFEGVCNFGALHLLLTASNYAIAVVANCRATRINCWKWQMGIGYSPMDNVIIKSDADAVISNDFTSQERWKT